MRSRLLLVSALTVLAVGVLTVAVRVDRSGTPTLAAATPSPPAVPTEGAAASPTSTPDPASPEPSATPTRPLHPLVDRSTVGQPWGEAIGLLQFRGNPTRTWYGRGPVPDSPEVLWHYPDRPMCTTEITGVETVTPTEEPSASASPTTRPIEKEWCGTGWTGQPAVWARPDGVTEVIFGAYDQAVHFVDAGSGEPTRPAFPTGGLIKGSVTVDPDGYPLLYVGSRDNKLRILALDRDAPTELWHLPAREDRVWNNDWDGNPVIVDGMLLEGGEDSWFHAVELNRAYDAEGRVTVAPEILLQTPGWTDQLFRDVGDYNVSIENSVAVHEGRAYFANSGGRVVGLDITRLAETGEAPVVLDYWVGDDVDGSIVIDEAGDLYVPVELERFLPRATEVGQLVKLDPDRPDDPLVWSVAVPPRPPPGVADDDGGIWATPALHAGVLYVTTHPGDLLAVDAHSGEVLYREDIGRHEWSSPVVVDDTLIVGGCERGALLAYDVTEPRSPRALWEAAVPTGGCIESTPAVWDGRIHVGSRDGHFYTFGAP